LRPPGLASAEARRSSLRGSERITSPRPMNAELVGERGKWGRWE
jgi:hypothetical protein